MHVEIKNAKKNKTTFNIRCLYIYKENYFLAHKNFKQLSKFRLNAFRNTIQLLWVQELNPKPISKNSILAESP